LGEERGRGKWATTRFYRNGHLQSAANLSALSKRT
jgi:hypothetical protein